MYVIIMRRQAQWPASANSTPTTPIYSCDNCGAQSSNGTCPRGC